MSDARNSRECMLWQLRLKYFNQRKSVDPVLDGSLLRQHLYKPTNEKSRNSAKWMTTWLRTALESISQISLDFSWMIFVGRESSISWKGRFTEHGSCVSHWLNIASASLKPQRVGTIVVPQGIQVTNVSLTARFFLNQHIDSVGVSHNEIQLSSVESALEWVDYRYWCACCRKIPLALMSYDVASQPCRCRCRCVLWCLMRQAGSQHCRVRVFVSLVPTDTFWTTDLGLEQRCILLAYVFRLVHFQPVVFSGTMWTMSWLLGQRKFSMSKCAIRSINYLLEFHRKKRAIESRSKIFFSMSVISSGQKSVSLVGNDRKQVNKSASVFCLPFIYAFKCFQTVNETKERIG